MSRPAVMMWLLATGCVGGASSDPLAIDRADTDALAGEYATPDGAIHFEATRDTARLFTDDGVLLAARYPGEATPASWQLATTPAPAPELLAHLPEVADALANAHLDAAASLVEIARDLEPPASARDTGDSNYSNYVWFPLNCYSREEFGYIGASNWEYVYRHATVSFFDASGSITYYAWVAPLSVRYFKAGGWYLTVGYGSGGGQMSFFQAGDWCN